MLRPTLAGIIIFLLGASFIFSERVFAHRWEECVPSQVLSM